MKSLNGVAVVAAWSALVAGGMAVAQEADCNVNGIPDATEIAQGLVDDCNGNGVPDVCEYAGIGLGGETSPFGNGNPLFVTIADASYAASDMRISIAVRADLDAVTEIVQAKIGNTVVATLWLTGGQACPSEPQIQSVVVPMATVNAAINANGGTLVVSLETSGLVSVKECPSSSAELDAEYIGDLPLPDCLANGVWDVCDIESDPSLDCDANGLLDLCELAADSSLDCDGSSTLDSCDLANYPSLDCDLSGTLDLCDIANTPSIDCDSNGEVDSCEIAADASLDCTANGVLNICELTSAALGSLCDPDCDGDGVHDACQLNADSSLDKNGDGILDHCQIASGDLTLDRVIDGADLAFMLGLWGTADPPIGDLTGDGTIDGADLAELLGQWGNTLLSPHCWATVLEFEPDPAIIPSTEWRDRIIATGLPWRVIDNISGIEMLLVPHGTFMMGCSAAVYGPPYGCLYWENPVHEVTLSKSFYLGRYEVTQAEWTAVMGDNPSHFQAPSAEVPESQVPNRPVEQVSWFMIQDFEAATGLRLPTEAEWEYSCRAGTQTAYNLPPNGTNVNTSSTINSLAWCVANGGAPLPSQSQTRPVGLKLPNNLGFHDMHGNVREWCDDWWADDYYTWSPSVDPPGPPSGSHTPGQRVLRGGSWSLSSPYLRSSYRYSQNPTTGYSEQGFRVARNP